MEGLLRDIQFGWRLLRRGPAFTLAATLALGLGVGATTAIFTVLDRVVLRPLPYPEPDRLVTIWETNRTRDLRREPLSPVNFGDYRSLSHVFEDAAAWWHPQLNLTETGRDPLRVKGVEASSNFFRVVGVQPILGAGFPGEPLFAPQAEAVISHRLWRDRFGADDTIVGRSIVLAGRPHIVVGVMPPGFSYPNDTDVWQRLTWDMTRHSRGAHFMEAVARLQLGVSAAVADTELRALTTRLGSSYRSTNGDWGAEVRPLSHEVAGEVRPALFALFGGALCLLLIACTNVASLLLARATVREREVAVRMALGAARSRLVRQFLTESVILAALGTAAGLVISVAAVRILLVASPVRLPRLDSAAPDWRVLAFALLVALATALLFGLAPAVSAARGDLQRPLKAGGRGGDESGTARVRGALVVGEIALSVVLLVGAAILTRSFARLVSADPGFRPGSGVAINLELPASYRDFKGIAAFYDRLLDRLRTQPGVQRAGASNFLPFEAGWRVRYTIGGRPQPPADDLPLAQHHTVDEDYFLAIGVPLLRGRFFTARDTADQPGVVVVNQALARRDWPTEDPIGRTITTGAQAIGPMGRMLLPHGAPLQVVGIVGDVRNGPLAVPVEPTVYFPYRQFPFRGLHLVVQGSSDMGSLVGAVRTAVQTEDPNLPLADSRTLESVLGAETERPRGLMFLMGTFAALALLLAGVGVHSVLFFAVNQRQRELGMRMALGAQPRDIIWLVARQAAGFTVGGVVLGLTGALVLGRTMSALLSGVDAFDATAFTLAAAIAAMSAAAAAVAPARRAAATDLRDALTAD